MVNIKLFTRTFTQPMSAVVAGICFSMGAAAEPLPISDQAIVSTGSAIYERHCAVCHGIEGEGGLVPDSAGIEAPNLTRLAARNGGIMPFWELYEQISGTELLPAHASRHMPIWGQALAVDGGEVDPDIARGRILSLMAWLVTMQVP